MSALLLALCLAAPLQDEDDEPVDLFRWARQLEALDLTWSWGDFAFAFGGEADLEFFAFGKEAPGVHVEDPAIRSDRYVRGKFADSPEAVGRLQAVLDRSPGMSRIRGLPVGVFSTAEVRRIGDPLYGELRRLGAMVDGDVALIPLMAVAQPADSLGVRVRVSAAVIHVRTGQVLWFGMVEGEPRGTSDPAALASSVDALARTLLWNSGR